MVHFDVVDDYVVDFFRVYRFLHVAKQFVAEGVFDGVY